MARIGRRTILAAALFALAAPVLAAPGDIEVEAPATPPPQIAPSLPAQDLLEEREPEPVVYRDLSRLPAAVAATREALMMAAATGDVAALQPILDAQGAVPTVSFGGAEDVVEYLRYSSADGAGREPLGIMLELLEAPFAVIGEGTEDEIYVWPYFAVVPLDELTPPELVELYKLVSHYDFEEMQHLGGWYFYRVGIAASGEWLYFVAGD